MTWGWVDDDNDPDTPDVWQRIVEDNAGTSREGFRSTVTGNRVLSDEYGVTDWTWTESTDPNMPDDTDWHTAVNDTVAEGDAVATAAADGSVKMDDNGNYIFDKLPTAAVEVQENVEGVDIQGTAAGRIGAPGQLVLWTTPFDVDNNKRPSSTVALPNLYGDDYYLLSYQLEIAGLSNDYNNGAFLATRYHNATTDAQLPVDSDLASTVRNGVGSTAAGITDRGMAITDIHTVTGVEGGDSDTATGTRVAKGDATANDGGRIVLASEAVADQTHLLFAGNYIKLPLDQLVRDEEAGTDFAGTTNYDWLTVDTHTVKVTEAGENLPGTTTVAGGNAGVVKPELKRITGVIWHDENNNGIQDKKEDGSGNFEDALNGYQVSLERYYSVNGSGTWVKDNSFGRTVRTGNVLMDEFAGGDALIAGALGEYIQGTDLYRSGTYEFDKLETSGVVTVNGTEQWVVYGYKVKVTDPRVTRGQVLKAKCRVTVNEEGDDVAYTQDSDLFGTNYAVDGNECIVLLDQVDVNGQTADGQTTQASNMIAAPASNNADVANVLGEREPMTRGNLVVYDLMSGFDRDHNDGGVIPVPTYKISGFLYEDADYDGLYNYIPETRTDTATDETVSYVEKGYNKKSVYLQKWFYVPNTGTGWDAIIPAGTTAHWVLSDGTVVAAKPAAADVAAAKGAWVMLDASNAATPKLSFYNGSSVETSAPIAGRVETKTDTYKNITGSEMSYRKALTTATGTADVDEEGALQYATESTDVDGYFQFSGLPTAGFLEDADGNRTWYLMGYTLEVDGSNAENGMFSLLVTSYEWQTTPADAINSDVQPMLTKDEEGEAEWLGYNTGNYPVLLDESTVQTGSGKHHTDWVETVVGADGKTTSITHNGAAANPNAGLETDGVSIWGNDAQIAQRVEGGVVRLNGISKNALDGKLVLAGMASADTAPNQRVSGTRNTGTAGAVNNVNYAFDFGIGQDQSAMNAGYAPPDHTNLYGAVWFDKGYTGIYDEENGLAGFKVALSQYYFVPTYNDAGYQLFEDEDGNLFYYASDTVGGKSYLHLQENKGANVIQGQGVDGARTVYLVRSGRAYNYQDLVDSGARKLFASGTWVLNKNFNGNGGEYRSASVAFDGNAAGLVGADGNPAVDENGDPIAVTGATAAIDGTNGASVTLPDCGFAAAGFHFIGWNTASDGTGTLYQPGDSFTLSEDAAKGTLYAMWEADEATTFAALRTFASRLMAANVISTEANEVSAVEKSRVAEGANNAAAANGIALQADEATAPAKTEDWELVTLTQEKGEYRFYDLPSYVAVDDDVKADEITDNSKLDGKVYQPQSEWNRLDRYQKGAVAVKGPDGSVLYYEAPAGFDRYDTATPYLVGYSVRVINDDPETAQYMVSKYHVDAPGERTSDITEFNASLNGDYNVDGSQEEAFAVVAQESKKESDIDFGTDRYEIIYRGVRYDLANRLYEKLAGDAGLVLQNPVLIAGKVWEDTNADGLQDAENEVGIPGAVVKLERYWYDTSGLGSLEPQPGEETPDVTPDNTSLTEAQIAEIYALSGVTYPAPEGEELLLPEELDVAQIANMVAWMSDISDRVLKINQDIVDGVELTDEDKAFKASALNKLVTFERVYKNFVDGYWKLNNETGSFEFVDPDETLARALQTAIFAVSDDNMDDLVGEDQKGVWRRDWTFSQNDAVVMVEGNEVSADSLTGRLSDEDAINLVGEDGDERDEIFFDQTGAAYIPGAAFDETVSSGDWAFLAPGTGYHKVGSNVEFKVLYGYRARIISYPNADDYLHTVQHVGVNMTNVEGDVNSYDEYIEGTDAINSDYDYETQALRPNVADKKQASLLSDQATVDETLTDLEVGDLIVVTRLADDTERSFTSGPNAKFADINDEGVVTVAFDGNFPGCADKMDAVSGLMGETVAVPACGFTRPGYVFTGWNSAADGSGTAFAVGAEVPLTGAVETLYAQWQLDPALVGTDVEVTLDGNVDLFGSVEGDMAPLTVKFGDTMELPACDYTLADHVFTGWNTQADGNGTAYAAGESLLVNFTELTLYAQWTVPVVDTPETVALFAMRSAMAPAAGARITFPDPNETAEEAKARMTEKLLSIWGQPGDVATDQAAVNAAVAAGVEWIASATKAQLENMDEDYRLVIFGDPVDENGDGVQDTKVDENGEEYLVHLGNGFEELYNAYKARMAELNRETTNKWSDIKWRDSVNHDFGLVPVARQRISGIVWQDTNYNGVRDGSEGQRFASIPVTLERYMWTAKADGSMGWVADDKFNNSARAHTVSDGNGYWEFVELEVAGTGTNGATVYGYRAKVDSLPGGYGVTYLNRGADGEVDSDLNENNKILEPADPYDGMIILAERYDGDNPYDATNPKGPNGTIWMIGLGHDDDFNDTGLVPYATATIAGIMFNDPENDGLKGTTFEPIPAQTVYLDRMVIPMPDQLPVGFNAASYVATALKDITANGIVNNSGWTQVAQQVTGTDGSYRFEGLPMVDGNNQPYIYRVRANKPAESQFVAINRGNNDNNDSDWMNMVGSSSVGITCPMAVLGAFTTVRTTPNAYGQMFNLLEAYDWTPEVGRAVDLGVTGADLGKIPPLKKLFPKLGDNIWLLAALAAALLLALLLLILAWRKRKEDEEDDPEDPEDPTPTAGSPVPGIPEAPEGASSTGPEHPEGSEAPEASANPTTTPEDPTPTAGSPVLGTSGPEANGLTEPTPNCHPERSGEAAQSKDLNNPKGGDA